MLVQRLTRKNIARRTNIGQNDEQNSRDAFRSSNTIPIKQSISLIEVSLGFMR